LNIIILLSLNTYRQFTTKFAFIFDWLASFPSWLQPHC